MNDIILKMQQLGFSPYEAKAYYTLLRKHPANGYEISKIGKIPAAKIYDTLNRLKVSGVIVESSKEAGKYYPIPPAKLIERVKANFSGIIEELEVQLKETGPVADLDVTMNFSGYDAIIDKMLSVISGSQNSLLVSLWPEETVLLAEAVAAATQRGVTVTAAVFGPCSLECTYGVNLAHCGDSSRQRLGKRLFAIASDNREVVVGETDYEGNADGIWTTTPGIVLVTKEYIKHDIWGNALIEALGEAGFKKLCGENRMLAYLIKNR